MSHFVQVLMNDDTRHNTLSFWLAFAQKLLPSYQKLVYCQYKSIVTFATHHFGYHMVQF